MIHTPATSRVLYRTRHAARRSYPGATAHDLIPTEKGGPPSKHQEPRNRGAHEPLKQQRSHRRVARRRRAGGV